MRRSALALVELLVVIAILGVLAGLLLPAVQSSRESSRRLQCQNNLRQISLATHSFHDVHGFLPPARISPRPGDPPPYDCGGSEPSWAVHLLPFLEQQAHWRLLT